MFQAVSRAFLVVLALVVIFQSGCIQRRFIVRSEPEGALVSIDRQPIGYTPVSVPFTYYGTREFRLEKDGFKTVQVQQRVPAPLYATFPISFITENFWPREIRDQRVLDFQLEPKEQVAENVLLERANQLRDDINRGTVTAPLSQGRK
jgi:hypothetical protein